MNDLIILTDIPSIIQKAAVKHDLNKAQTNIIIFCQGETISKYAQKNNEFFNKIHQDFKAGYGILVIAQKYFVPQPLVWSVILRI